MKRMLVVQHVELEGPGLLLFGDKEALVRLEEETRRWWQENRSIRRVFLGNICLFLERGA